MDFFTHFLIGMLLGFYTLHPLGYSFVVYAGLMAILPDFDVLLSPLVKITRSNLFSHKAISHTLLSGVLISLVTSIPFSVITGESFFTAWLIGAIYYDIHVFLDFLMASKVMLFFPFSKRKFRFFIDRAINFYLFLTTVGIMVVYTILFFYMPLTTILLFSNFVFGFYILYLSYRFLVKLWFYFKLTKHEKFIPGISPLNYYIYSINTDASEQQFKLTKKSIFSSKSTIIIESSLKIDSPQAILYEKSLLLAKEYPFFTKWEDKIPIIVESEDTVKVIILLAESYRQDSGYGFQVLYNKRTNEIIEKSEGFNFHVRNFFV
ncbi:MAG: metal-dependent hydrolase [Candidatus Lokiarchaeota archaeon]|nr:metal-dependent hydrolase [Candidatus Lokiarchaeota archaeon]